VKPAADLNRIEEVLVVTEKQEREPAVAESGTRVRAADILAQRLPSVPDKPAVVGGTVPAKSAASGASVPGLGAGSKPQANPAGKPATGTGEVLRKVVQKTAPGDSANTGGTGSAASSSTTNSVPSSANPSSANPTAKPVTAQPKPATPPANPQPATTDDNPH
jgi:hypothetical protein